MSTAYIFACGLGGLVWTGFFLYRPDLRPVMLGMSCIGLPLAFSDIFYVPQYWRPHTIGNIPVGLEGFLFTFEAAGICSIVFAAVFRRTLRTCSPTYHFPARELVRVRTLIPFLPLPISSLVSIVLHTNLEWGLFAGLLVTTAVVLSVRSDLALPVILGGLAFLPIYWLALTIWLLAYPSVHDWFTLWHMPRWFFLGVPVWEIAFGAIFGAYWTAVYPLVFEARFEKEGA